MNRTKFLLRILVLLVTVIVTVISVVLWCQRPAPPVVAFEPQARAVLGPAGESDNASPQIAYTANGTLDLLVGTGTASPSRLALVRSPDGGDTFTAPLPISAPGAVVMSRGEMSPVLRAQGEGIFALWQQTVGAAPSQIVSAASTNAGRTFSAPVPVVVKPQPSFTGFANLGLAPNNQLFSVWLDGRDPNRAPGTFDVYLAQSADKGVTWSPAILVAPGSCPCCRPAVAADGQGNVYVAWRKVYPGQQRDLALSISHDGGRTFAAPIRVANEHWTLQACPESGPTVVLRNGGVVVAWYSGAGQPGIRVATSGDNAQTFRVTAVSTAVLDQNRPRLSLSEDGNLWLSLEGRQANSGAAWSPLTAFVVEVSNNGSLSAPVLVPGGPVAGYPAVAAASAGRLFVASARESMGHDTLILARARQPQRAAGPPR